MAGFITIRPIGAQFQQMQWNADLPVPEGYEVVSIQSNGPAAFSPEQRGQLQGMQQNALTAVDAIRQAMAAPPPADFAPLTPQAGMLRGQNADLQQAIGGLKTMPLPEAQAQMNMARGNIMAGRTGLPGPLELPPHDPYAYARPSQPDLGQNQGVLPQLAAEAMAAKKGRADQQAQRELASQRIQQKAAFDRSQPQRVSQFSPGEPDAYRNYMLKALTAKGQANRGEMPTAWPGAWRGPVNSQALDPAVAKEKMLTAMKGASERSKTRQGVTDQRRMMITARKQGVPTNAIPAWMKLQQGETATEQEMLAAGWQTPEGMAAQATHADAQLQQERAALTLQAQSYGELAKTAYTGGDKINGDKFAKASAEATAKLTQIGPPPAANAMSGMGRANVPPAGPAGPPLPPQATSTKKLLDFQRQPEFATLPTAAQIAADPTKQAEIDNVAAEAARLGITQEDVDEYLRFESGRLGSEPQLPVWSGGVGEGSETTDPEYGKQVGARRLFKEKQNYVKGKQDYWLRLKPKLPRRQ